MKRILPVCLLLIGCGAEPQEEQTMPVVETDSNEVLIDNVIIEEIIDPINPFLAALLEKPIDLIAFKKKWGPSNSGATGGYDVLDIPEKEGQLYRFMLFHKLRDIIPSHPKEGELFNKFQITVFRFVKVGEPIGDFFDTNEELMMIECALDNSGLGELNWYGKSKVQLMDKYGAPQYESNDCMIYEHEGKTISAHLTNDKVDWYKYVKLNPELDMSIEIPEILLNF